jgi:hypothetical protein
MVYSRIRHQFFETSLSPDAFTCQDSIAGNTIDLDMIRPAPRNVFRPRDCGVKAAFTFCGIVGVIWEALW